MNIEHHSNYTQRFKLMERALECILDGYVPDWVALECPEKQKEQFKVIQNIAKKHGYKIGAGSTAGYLETPVKIIIAEPAENYDFQISGFLRELATKNLLASGSVIFSDGTPGNDFSNDFSALAKEKGIDIRYNDNKDQFKAVKDVVGYGRKLHAIEQRNYQTFAPALIANRDKIAVQKVGILETLEGGIQQNLTLEEIPYLVLLPIGVKRDYRKENAIDLYIQECIDKTAKRLGLQ